MTADGPVNLSAAHPPHRRRGRGLDRAGCPPEPPREPTPAPPSFTTRPTCPGSFGMGASTHWLATATAQAVLERGGNAFDASVAAAFVLHVVEPHLNGPGGDLVGIFATADAPAADRADGSGSCTGRGDDRALPRGGLDLVPGAGGLRAAVPRRGGCVAALLRDHGTVGAERTSSPTLSIDYAPVRASARRPGCGDDLARRAPCLPIPTRTSSARPVDAGGGGLPSPVEDGAQPGVRRCARRARRTSSCLSATTASGPAARVDAARHGVADRAGGL